MSRRAGLRFELQTGYSSGPSTTVGWRACPATATRTRLASIRTCTSRCLVSAGTAILTVSSGRFGGLAAAERELAGVAAEETLDAAEPAQTSEEQELEATS